jgi:hypothetical protein
VSTPTTSGAERATVDWLKAITQTKTSDMFHGVFELGVVEGEIRSTTVVRSEIDFEQSSAHSVIASAGQQLAEVLWIGDRGWVRLEDPAFVALLPEGTKYAEAATTDLVSSGLISVDRDVTWAALYFTTGATAIDLTWEQDGVRSYRLIIDVTDVEGSVPSDELPIFMSLFADMVNPALVREAEATVELDEENRIVLLDLRFHLATDSDATFVVRLQSRFDEPVVVVPPDPDLVVDAYSVAGMMEMLTGPGPGR